MSLKKRSLKKMNEEMEEKLKETEQIRKEIADLEQRVAEKQAMLMSEGKETSFY